MPGGHPSEDRPDAEGRVFGTLWALLFVIPFSLAALLMAGVLGRSLWREEWLAAVICFGFTLGFGGFSVILWGSIFSFSDHTFLWKWPRRFPYPITVNFGSVGALSGWCPSPICHNRVRRSRSAFAMTDTELKLIAAPAMMGLSSTPKNG